ncbi:hypothetical protein VNI00_003393 [Paramarasmius palmivorus]|uniref:Uncharacterized protein n=1 Tax=Paramarasmius palmivorus TaxID=297713 RepID=A0AAW0DUP9_9AGAR
MLPTSPRAGGLPSGPRSGRAIGPGGRSRREETDHGTSTTSRYPRSQTSERQTIAHKRSQPRLPRNQANTSASSSSSAPRRSNDSSTSSSGSSLFDRMKTGASSYASSFTSVEDNQDKEEVEENDRSRWQQGEGQDNQPGNGYGYTIWSRVASAAGNLTVNVGKAWAANITIYAGEETPPGQESRLTRAMKAYHIEKARDPTELPPWLFDEHERKPRRTAPKESAMDRAETERPTPRSATPRGLRDVYDAAVSSTVPIHQSGLRDTSSGTQRTERKGTDRLRALREGKRMQGAQGVQEPPQEVAPSRPPPRVGLPGGPARSRRQV